MIFTRLERRVKALQEWIPEADVVRKTVLPEWLMVDIEKQGSALIIQVASNGASLPHGQRM